MDIQRSLLLTSCSWDSGNYESFRMIPVRRECPYVESFYDPIEKILVVLSKDKKESLAVLPKLDEYGNGIQKNKRPLADRHRITCFKEFYIDKPEEIREFIKLFAINAASYDFEKYLQGLVKTSSKKNLQFETTT